MISEDLQVVFVHTPKNAGTSIKNALARDFRHGDWHYTIDDLLTKCKLPSHYYYKFAVCRNPYSRFVSAFRYNMSKVADPSDYHWRSYPLSYSLLQRFEGNEIASFRTFVKSEYFDRIFDRGWPIHFRKQSYFFTPSKVDDVVWFEDLARGMEVVAKRTGIEELESLYALNVTSLRRSDYLGFYDAETMDRVKKAYWDDFKTMGYNPDFLNEGN